MLTKSGAKAFFLVGTFLCSTAFILLTVDTFKQIPAQTNEQNISEDVKLGKELWESNNCMGCHTLFGEGAYYAPELTKVYERRGEGYIRQMLKDPQAMFPNDRKMQKYDFTDAEITAVVAFLKWCGEVNLNGFPAKPPLEKTVSTAQVAMPESPKVFQQTCTACHALNGNGGTVGPALDGIGSRRDIAWIAAWLKDPIAIKADSKMPKLPLTEEEIQQLATFLANAK